MLLKVLLKGVAKSVHTSVGGSCVVRVGVGQGVGSRALIHSLRNFGTLTISALSALAQLPLAAWATIPLSFINLPHSNNNLPSL